MAIRIPRLDRTMPIVGDDGRPSFAFHNWWDQASKAIETSLNSIADNVAAIQAALDAADIAQAAATSATAAAATAQAAADGATTVSKLSGSGVSGCTISAADAGTAATVTISAHTRVYSDGTSVSVAGGSITGLLYSTTYYIYYDDPAFAGGTVTYLATTSDATAAQTGDRHLVGSIATPASGGASTGGKLVKPPGVSGIEP